jgi:hypothetical protein
MELPENRVSRAARGQRCLCPGLSRRICGCHIPSRSGYQAPYPLEGGRCRRPALGPIGAAGNRGEGAAPTILCRNGSPKTIARQTREILCLPVSCDASTAANDPQFLQRTLCPVGSVVLRCRLFRKICGLNFLPVDAGYDNFAGVSNSFPLLAGADYWTHWRQRSSSFYVSHCFIVRCRLRSLVAHNGETSTYNCSWVARPRCCVQCVP